jgi:peptidoglycan/LPS O-acetylase OafA/YrhL
LAIRQLAGMSYSIYLTHSLMLHVARALAAHCPVGGEFVYWPLALALTLAAGYGFSVLVERSSLRLRDRLVPSFAVA